MMILPRRGHSAMIIKKAEKAKKSKESSKTPKGRVPKKKKAYFLLVFLQGPNPGKKKVKIKEQKNKILEWDQM